VQLVDWFDLAGLVSKERRKRVEFWNVSPQGFEEEGGLDGPPPPPGYEMREERKKVTEGRRTVDWRGGRRWWGGVGSRSC
jgi:hypothetical protein